MDTKGNHINDPEMLGGGLERPVRDGRSRPVLFKKDGLKKKRDLKMNRSKMDGQDPFKRPSGPFRWTVTFVTPING
ncbi:hypothetical protein BpHYR1_036648 [Brachionus plicatilis]|uniref:Uncharacterized protein n=1 Tax=Brachionus plicatilis TaxID=10195 RepID=A0A3M7SNL3_BRAPC|nr:hypothetical protein BpHYR1_036648 [Brachionus plicatilis]